MREQLIRPILKELHSACDDIESSAVISSDGLAIAAILPQETNEDDISAITASLSALGARMIDSLKCGELKQLVISATEGNVMISAAGPDAILVVIVRKSKQIESISQASKRAAQSISALLESQTN